jgi:hypothetical protein
MAEEGSGADKSCTVASFNGIEYGISIVDQGPLFCVVFPLHLTDNRAVSVIRSMDDSGEAQMTIRAPEHLAEDEASIWVGAAVVGLTFAQETIDGQ